MRVWEGSGQKSHAGPAANVVVRRRAFGTGETSAVCRRHEMFRLRGGSLNWPAAAAAIDMSAS